MKSKPSKYTSEADALLKLQRYCAYQDRCHQEVRTKLKELGIYGEAFDRILIALIEDNFLNEERFAKSYTGGKFRIKKWGRQRIRQELKRRGVSDYCIKKGLQEIEEAAYLKTMHQLLAKKTVQLDASNRYALRAKLAQHLIRKGYESHLVWEVVKAFTEE